MSSASENAATVAKTSLSHDDYTVAWICPLEVEQIAATVMLDQVHPRLPQPQTDHNAYTLGSIQEHNVVIAGLPTAGNASAATVVAQMAGTFRQLRFGLLVGIGGGVPTQTDEGYIRLGHVVVSKPTGEHSGAIQYDHGKAEVGQFRRTGALAPPPHVLLSAAQRMSVACALASTDPLTNHLQRVNTSRPRLRRYKHPGAINDSLYEPDYVHSDRKASCQKCGCDPGRKVDRDIEGSNEEDREKEEEQYVVVHRGTVAVGEKVMRDGLQRDKLAQEHDILCFEMEAAGALNDFPCLVIRGISDYSDSHKNDIWHGRAAAVAAAYARGLFFHMPVDEVKQCRVVEADIKQMVHSIQTLAFHSNETKIKSWLSPVDASINYTQALLQRHPGTGQWFLAGDTYAQWKARFTSALWLYGIPGCGKSVLSSTIIEDLQQKQNTTNHTLLYFYFNFSEPDKQSFEKMLRTLIYELYRQHRVCQNFLDDLYSFSQNGREQPQTKSLIAILNSMIGATSNVSIILDALDECSTRRQLLPWLQSLDRKDVQVLVTSRQEEDIESSLVEWMPAASVVSIQQTAVDNDIRAVVRSRLMKDKDFERWRSMPEAREQIEEQLMAKTDGMFRWAACQLDVLAECIDILSLEDALSTLPDTLDETYHRILNRIPPWHRQHAFRLLQFLAFAERPLTLEEAVDAIAVRPDRTPAFEERNRMPVPRDIARVCSSLTIITIRQDCDKDDYHESKTTERSAEIRLAHFSVKEYLVSNRVAEGFRDLFKKSRAEAEIVRVSLAYLVTAADNTNMSTDSRSPPFARFCARYWMRHARAAEQEARIAEDWTEKAFSQPRVFLFWLRLFKPDRPWDTEEGLPYPIGTPLYYASLGGLEKCVRLLLRKDAEVNAQGGFYGNALQAASSRGHIEVVRLLLDKEANIYAQGGHYGSALQAASFGGHIEVVQLLLDKEADINAQGRVYGSALQAASSGGHIELVRLLLDKDADVNAQGGHYGNALQAASSKGHIEVVRLLLDKEADINAQGGVYGSALQAASSKGHIEVVRLLLDKEADVNAQGREFSNALQAASFGGYEEIVQLLLDKEADVNAQGRECSNAL